MPQPFAGMRAVLNQDLLGGKGYPQQYGSFA